MVTVKRCRKPWDWWIFCVFPSILFANLMWLDDYPMCVGLDASRFWVGPCNPLQVGVKDSPISLRIPVMMVFRS